MPFEMNKPDVRGGQRITVRLRRLRELPVGVSLSVAEKQRPPDHQA
jgi:hypothetical protein